MLMIIIMLLQISIMLILITAAGFCYWMALGVDPPGAIVLAVILTIAVVIAFPGLVIR